MCVEARTGKEIRFHASMQASKQAAYEGDMLSLFCRLRYSVLCVGKDGKMGQDRDSRPNDETFLSGSIVQFSLPWRTVPLLFTIFTS